MRLTSNSLILLNFETGVDPVVRSYTVPDDPDGSDTVTMLLGMLTRLPLDMFHIGVSFHRIS